MKQANLPIDPPIVDRKCQWGVCDKDYAYRLCGVDLCFEHGQEQINAAIVSHAAEIATIGHAQLPLIKP
jgi:hypothetical protein